MLPFHPQALMKTEQNEPFSINRLSELTGWDRRKLKSTLAGLPPLKMVNGAPQHSLGVALRAILAEAGDKRSDEPEIIRERIRLLAAQASREQLQLAVDRAEYVSVELFRLAWAELAIDIRRRVESLPNAVSSKLVGKTSSEIHSILTVEAARCLNDLATADVNQPIGRGIEKFQKLHPESIVEK